MGMMDRINEHKAQKARKEAEREHDLVTRVQLINARVDEDGFLVEEADLLLWFHRTFSIRGSQGAPAGVHVENGELVVTGDASWRPGLRDAVTQNGRLGKLAGRFSTVSGHFSLCSQKADLTSLSGCPLSVGSFSCHGQLITSLKGGPDTVQDDYRVNFCTELVDCGGGPTSVGGEMDISRNRLVDLTGCPISVGGFNASANCLTRLTGGPQILDSGDRPGRYLAHDNPLDPLDGLRGLVVEGGGRDGYYLFPASVGDALVRLGVEYHSNNTALLVNDENWRVLMVRVARATLGSEALRESERDPNSSSRRSL